MQNCLLKSLLTSTHSLSPNRLLPCSWIPLILTLKHLRTKSSKQGLVLPSDLMRKNTIPYSLLKRLNQRAPTLMFRSFHLSAGGGLKKSPSLFQTVVQASRQPLIQCTPNRHVKHVLFTLSGTSPKTAYVAYPKALWKNLIKQSTSV